jgi:hypothetical protein
MVVCIWEVHAHIVIYGKTSCVIYCKSGIFVQVFEHGSRR